MSTEPESFIYGKKPPYVRSFKVSPRRSNGRNEKDVTIEYIVLQENKSAFVASLPYTLQAGSLTPIFSAEDIAAHGIVSSAYEGLDLQSVQDSGEGRVRTLTITYSTPQATTENISWWSSSDAGLVYHERARITLAQSQTYAEAALADKYGLPANGANISPEADNIHATYEATWGPEEEDDDGEEEEDDGTAKSTGTIVSSISSESVPLSRLDILHSLGMNDAVSGEYGTKYIDQIVAMLESGQIFEATDFEDGQKHYFYNSPDALSRQRWEPKGDASLVNYPMEEILAYSKAVAANPVTVVPCTTVSISYKQKVVSTSELVSTDVQIGEKLKSGDSPAAITTGGVNIPPPSYSFKDPQYADIPTQTYWVYCGRSSDNIKIKKSIGLNGQVQKFKEVTFTDSYKSVTVSTLTAAKSST